MTSRTRGQHERVRERAIIMTGDSVRAILAGRKTQTRRKVRFPGWACGVLSDRLKIDVETDDAGRDPEVICESTGCLAALPLPYAIGDQLWVRETWQAAMSGDGPCILYRADNSRWSPEWTGPDEGLGSSFDYDRYTATYSAWASDIEASGPWASPTHMPRWASRLPLAVTDVRVQRLQDISEADALAEGAPDYVAFCETINPGARDTAGETAAETATRLQWAQRWYERAWNSLHGPGAWDANPWVAAVSFTVDRASGSIAGRAK